MLEIEASKNILFKTLVPEKDLQTLTQLIELIQYNWEN